MLLKKIVESGDSVQPEVQELQQYGVGQFAPHKSAVLGRKSLIGTPVGAGERTWPSLVASGKTAAVTDAVPAAAQSQNDGGTSESKLIPGGIGGGGGVEALSHPAVNDGFSGALANIGKTAAIPGLIATGLTQSIPAGVSTFMNSAINPITLATLADYAIPSAMAEGYSRSAFSDLGLSKSDIARSRDVVSESYDDATAAMDLVGTLSDAFGTDALPENINFDPYSREEEMAKKVAKVDIEAIKKASPLHKKASGWASNIIGGIQRNPSGFFGEIAGTGTDLGDQGVAFEGIAGTGTDLGDQGFARPAYSGIAGTHTDEGDQGFATTMDAEFTQAQIDAAAKAGEGYEPGDFFESGQWDAATARAKDPNAMDPNQTFTDPVMDSEGNSAGSTEVGNTGTDLGDQGDTTKGKTGAMDDGTDQNESIGSGTDLGDQGDTTQGKSGGGNDSGGDKILCGELNRQGILADDLYRADLKYAEQVDPVVVAGYHFWAKPLVKKMRKSRLLTFLVSFFVIRWATHMAFKVGVVKKDSFIGKWMERIFVPICWFIGGFIEDPVTER